MSRRLFAVCLKSIAIPAREIIAPKTGHKNTFNLIGAWRLYGTSIECQTTVPIKRWIQNEIINALCSGERNQASRLLSELVSEKQDLESRDFVEILSYCASKPDPLFVMETWNLMKEKEIPVPPRHGFRYIIRALCKGGYLKEAFNILSTLEENSAGTLLLPLCNIFLRASIEIHEFDYANHCLHLMEHRALGKSEMTYALLLKLAVLQKDLSAVHGIWKECTNVCPMSILILRQFVCAFKSLKDLASANATLQIMVAVSSEGNSHIVRSSKGKPHHDPLTLDICENSNIPANLRHDYYTEENSNTSGFKFGLEAKGIRAISLSLSPKPFTEDMVKILQFSFNDVIHTCASLRNISLAEQLFHQMQNLGLEPSSYTYDGYARALARGRGFQYGVEVLELMEQKNMKPHQSTLAALSVSCSKALELDLAEKFLDQIPGHSRAYPYNALFQACDTLDQSERAMWFYAKMKHLNVTPDIRTYEMLFRLFGNVHAPYEEPDRLSQTDGAKRIKAIEMDMRGHGIQHNYNSLRNLLKALGMEGLTTELRSRLYLVEDFFFDGNTSRAILLYSNVLHSLVDAKETHAAIELFKCILSCGLTPDEVTYNTMIDCCRIIECYRSASAVVSMMIRSGFCPDIVTYTTLTKVLLKSNDFDKALKLLVLAHSEGIQFDRLYYNTILRRASEKGIIDLVELIVELMHQDKIEPDTSTCERVFSAYTTNGFDNTAMEALEVLSMRMISEDDDIRNETRMKYENLIFSEGIDTESQIIQVFRTSPTLATALLQLRWCSIMGFPVSWSPNQSPWAKRLSLTHARPT